MVKLLIALTILIPWLGALLVWWIGDKREKLQHLLAVIFSVISGGTAIALQRSRFAEHSIGERLKWREYAFHHHLQPAGLLKLVQSKSTMSKCARV